MHVEGQPSGTGLWRRALLLLLLAVPPLLAGLGENDCVFHMEVRTVGSTLETWLAADAGQGHWLIPSWNGQPRVNKPPLAVWITRLAWLGLSTEAPVDTLVWRARLAGVAAALLTLLAVAWAGWTLCNGRFGLAAAAVTGTSLFFLRNARLATYDTYLLAFGSLAMAAAWWALQPGQPAGRRPHRFTGWLISGLALGLAILSKGPLALLLVGMPILIAAAFHRDRRTLLTGALVALVLALAVAAPWYLWIVQQVPEAARLLLTEYEAERVDGQPPWYYLGLIGLVFPWSIWMVAGSIMPFRKGERTWSDQLKPAALWFFWILIVLSLPEAKQQRYILPILPAAGLLAAGAWGRSDPGGRLMRFLGWGQLAMMLVVSLAVAALPWLAPARAARAGLDYPFRADWPAAVFVVASLLLALVAFIAVQSWRRGRAECGLWLTALWMSMLATPGLWVYARSERGHYEHRAAVERVAALTRGQPFHYLAGPYTEPQYIHPDPRFRLYAKRVPTPLALERALQLDRPAWLTAPVHEKTDRALKKRGWTAVMDYRDKGPVRRLYQLDPAAQGHGDFEEGLRNTQNKRNI